MKNNYYLSIDVGASSGRFFVTKFNQDDSLSLIEVYRFQNKLIEDDRLYWDFKHLFKEILIGLQIAINKFPNIKKIGIDTWGCDYGLIDFEGNLIRNPISYRDRDHLKNSKEAKKIVPFDKLYKETGIQDLSFNTIYQLFANFNNEKKLMKQVKYFLMIPDLIAYYLTGNARLELTNLSTTSMLNPNTLNIIDYIQDLGINKNIFAPLIKPGESYGFIKEKYNLGKVEVVAVSSHDTASATLTLNQEKDSMFISSGTWSLIGKIIKSPIINNEVKKENISNELGLNHIKFLKNTSGLFVLNECMKEWQIENRNLTITTINNKVEKINGHLLPIDLSKEIFLYPNNMSQKIKDEYLNKYNEEIYLKEEIAKVIYISLVNGYKEVINKIETITNETIKRITIIGGGSLNKTLNNLIRSTLNIDVNIGFNEASVIGNAMVLWFSDNKFNSYEDIRNKLKSMEIVYEKI